MAKVILTHEVQGLGIAGDVVDVKDGYARNFLVPRKLATPWSAGAEKQIEGLRKARRAKEIESIEGAQAARDALQSATVTVEAKAGDAGRLFGAVTPADIEAACRDFAVRAHAALGCRGLSSREASALKGEPNSATAVGLRYTR